MVTNCRSIEKDEQLRIVLDFSLFFFFLSLSLFVSLSLSHLMCMT